MDLIVAVLFVPSVVLIGSCIISGIRLALKFVGIFFIIKGKKV